MIIHPTVAQNQKYFALIVYYTLCHSAAVREMKTTQLVQKSTEETYKTLACYYL